MKHGTKAPTSRIVALHRRGLSCRKIARLVGMHPASVWKRLARRGIRRRKGVLERFDAFEVTRAARLYEQGFGLRAVARLLRLRNGNATARLLRAHGVEIREAT